MLNIAVVSGHIVTLWMIVAHQALSWLSELSGAV
jgi:hypothetical protein